MATVTAPPIITNNPTSPSTDQHVYLYDWWLIKTPIDVNGKKLAVGGFKYGGLKDPQMFSSAPIVKKYDFGTLQTADGVNVYIEGSINKNRTLKNGISSEVCNRFRFGFPYDWDDSRYHCGEDSMSTGTSCPSNDWANQKEGGTDENMLTEKFKDASNDTVLQASAECLGQFDVELQKTEDALAKNSVGRAEVVSSTSRGRMGGIKKSLVPFEARRSRRLRNMKKGTDGGQDIETNKSPLVSLESDLVTENEIRCESGVEDVMVSPFTRPHKKSNYLDDVNLTGMKGKTILTSPNDGPKISGKNAICDSDSTRGDAFGYDIDSVNPSAVNMAALVETANGVGGTEGFSSTSCGKIDGNTQLIGLFEAKRSSKTLGNVKNDMTMSVGKINTGDNKQGTSRCKTKRRLDYITEVITPPISRSKRKKLSLLSPEESSCKKSGSGRLTVPPLDYWRNQQVFYDFNRRVAGVLNGSPLTESCTDHGMTKC